MQDNHTLESIKSDGKEVWAKLVKKNVKEIRQAFFEHHFCAREFRYFEFFRKFLSFRKKIMKFYLIKVPIPWVFEAKLALSFQILEFFRVFSALSFEDFVQKKSLT